jgi:hypothetical protein
LKQIRELLTKGANYETEAESEIPDKVRRFTMYMHDLYNIRYIYEESGQPAPQYVLRELERCDDRFRQLLDTLHSDGGVFEKVRREMAEDPNNRWDHTRQLTKPEEKKS